MDHPLASVSAFITRDRRQLQDLLDNARDKVEILTESLVRDRLELLLALRLYLCDNCYKHTPVGSVPGAKDRLNLAQLVARHDVHRGPGVKGNPDLLPIGVRLPVALRRAVANIKDRLTIADAHLPFDVRLFEVVIVEHGVVGMNFLTPITIQHLVDETHDVFWHLLLDMVRDISDEVCL